MTDAHSKPEWAQSRFEKDNAERVGKGLKPRRRIWRWIVLAAIVAGIVAFALTRPAPEAPVEDPDEAVAVARQLAPGEIAEIAPSTVRQTVKVSGTLSPARQTSIASQTSGRVISVSVRPGDTVATGDTLAVIDRETLELQLNQQRATTQATRIQLASARQQLERTEELARRGQASASALEQARSSAAALEANLAALENAVAVAEIALENATVLSPIDGVVSARSVEPGQTVAAGTALFTIVNLDEMEFEASASVNFSALVTAGQAATISVAGLDGHTFEGRVTRVNPVATAGTRAVPIYISLGNEEGLLRGGMFATGFVTVAEKHDAIAIPATALREDAEGDFVLKLDGGTLVRQPVEKGEGWDRGRIVEVDGVLAGDVIVIAPFAELDPGDAYEMVEN